MNGPQLWAAILAPIREVYGQDAVIAGGAVRDYLLGRAPKDIDVFVNVDKDTLVARRAELPGEFSLQLLTPEEMSEYEENPDWVHEVTGVLDGNYYAPENPGDFISDSIQLQVIGRPMADFSGESLSVRFDFNICKCWYDGEIHDTPEAKADRDAMTMTLARWDTPEHVTASMKRYERKKSQFRFVDGRTLLGVAA